MNGRLRASGGVLRLPNEVAIHFGEDPAEAESLADDVTKVGAVNSLGDVFHNVARVRGNAVVSAWVSSGEEPPSTLEAAERCLTRAR